MKKLFNEFGFSFVKGNGNWIGCSYEIEDGDYEERKWGFKTFDIKNLKGIYLRFWIYKKVLVLATTEIKIVTKNKIGLKFIIGLEASL